MAQSDPDSAGSSTGAPDAEQPGVGSTLARSAKIAVLVFGLLVAGIAVASWLGGDASTLPFDYEGFD